MKAYDYWWGYTAAQIELMAVDQPLVVYKKDKKKVTKKDMDKVYEEWENRKHKFKPGETINLNDYLNGGEDKPNSADS